MCNWCRAFGIKEISQREENVHTSTMRAVTSERRKYCRSESMGGYGEGSEWVPLLPWWSGVVPPQNPAFWFVLGRKMCSSTPYRNISTISPEHY